MECPCGRIGYRPWSGSWLLFGFIVFVGLLRRVRFFFVVISIAVTLPSVRWWQVNPNWNRVCHGYRHESHRWHALDPCILGSGVVWSTMLDQHISHHKCIVPFLLFGSVDPGGNGFIGIWCSDVSYDQFSDIWCFLYLSCSLGWRVIFNLHDGGKYIGLRFAIGRTNRNKIDCQINKNWFLCFQEVARQTI